MACSAAHMSDAAELVVGQLGTTGKISRVVCGQMRATPSMPDATTELVPGRATTPVAKTLVARIWLYTAMLLSVPPWFPVGLKLVLTTWYVVTLSLHSAGKLPHPVTPSVTVYVGLLSNDR
eukprot:3589620-Pleurochrysis_carterae.AAC.4